jgi:hypothetical protein
MAAPNRPIPLAITDAQKRMEAAAARIPNRSNPSSNRTGERSPVDLFSNEGSIKQVSSAMVSSCGDLATCAKLCAPQSSTWMANSFNNWMWNSVCHEYGPEAAWCQEFNCLYTYCNLDFTGPANYYSRNHDDFAYSAAGFRIGDGDLVWGAYRYHILQGFARSLANAQQRTSCWWLPGCDYYQDVNVDNRVEPTTQGAVFHFCGDYSDND